MALMGPMSGLVSSTAHLSVVMRERAKKTPIAGTADLRGIVRRPLDTPACGGSNLE
jgi:hypothetical protein